ncbi:MAG: O-methyltransferase [Elusimicrobia bacterium]|nr:O-methyltransferase [Elusimicrobiota bacterium]
MLDFVTGLLAREDAVLRAIREETPERGLPPISVGPDEGRILHFLASAVGARRIVEVGTLAGYSACWLARALPADGVLHTVEFDPRHAAVARENIARAGLSSRVVVHEGPGAKVLPTLTGEGPFDLCFIDADKEGYPVYARWAADNLRPGGLVVCDNAYLFGKLHRDDLPAGDADAPKVPAMRACLRGLADESLFKSAAMLPTGEGMAVAVRR